MNANYSEALEQHVRSTRLWAAYTAAHSGGAHKGHDAYAGEDDAGLSMLRTADTFFWGPDQCKLIQSGAATMPSWFFSVDQFEARCGFAWFDSPLLIDGLQRGVGSMLWCLAPEDDGVFLVCWPYEGTRQAIPAYKTFWKFSDSLPEVGFSDDGHSDSLNREAVFTQIYCSWMVRVLAANVAFLNQHILVIRTAPAERHSRRRVAREGWYREPLIRVVELRRRERIGGNHPVEAVERGWQCQWLVRGHWRQQYYPSRKANNPLWITPYVKGPDDKPLKPPRATVFAVVR